MYAHKLSLTALSLGAALAFGTPANSADLPKEGTFSSTYSGVTTVKASPIGKERLLLTGEGYGLSVGEGILDHMTWHCLGLGDFTNGTGQFRGNCVGTDPAGDQLVTNFSTEKRRWIRSLCPDRLRIQPGPGSMPA
jgi:hypothetical protein